MDIRLYVSKKGKTYIACLDGIFKHPIEYFELDHTTQFLRVKLKDNQEPVGLNCHIDESVIDIMKKQQICLFGIHRDGKVEKEYRLPLKHLH